MCLMTNVHHSNKFPKHLIFKIIEDVAVGDYRNYIHQDFNCGETIINLIHCNFWERLRI